MLKTADDFEIKKYNYYYIIEHDTATIKKAKCEYVSLAMPLFASPDPKDIFSLYKEDYCTFSHRWRLRCNQKDAKKCIYRKFENAKKSLLKKINGLKGFYTKKYKQTVLLKKKDLKVEKGETWKIKQ